jgi:hypothetical protein
MEKKVRTNRPNLFSWQAYFGEELSKNAWKKMKAKGITSQSQFIMMAVKNYVDNDGK